MSSSESSASSSCRSLSISVNQLVSSALAEKLSPLDAERYLLERAQRGRSVDIDAILAKVPDVEPEEHGRLPPAEPGRPFARWLRQDPPQSRRVNFFIKGQAE